MKEMGIECMIEEIEMDEKCYLRIFPSVKHCPPFWNIFPGSRSKQSGLWVKLANEKTGCCHVM